LSENLGSIEEKVPEFKKIQCNSYSSNIAKKIKIEMSTCNCVPESKCMDQCINRAMLYECDFKSCPCGNKCTNREIQNGKTVPVEVFLTKLKGWGLKSTSKINAGTLIIEYVGKVIEESQKQIFIIIHFICKMVS